MSSSFPDDARSPATQAAIDRDTKRLLEKLDPLPAKLAPLVAAESDPAKVRMIINEEIRRVRRDIEITTQQMVDRFGATEH